MRTRTKVIAAVILIMLAVSAVGIVVVGRRLAPRLVIAFEQFLYAKVRDQWGQRIKEVGAAQAYKEIKGQLGPSSQVAHGVMHVFGELLYETQGMDGLKVCDASSNYGCYHGFITWAIDYEGPSAVPEIGKRCRDLFGDDEILCRHGLGHGLYEYYGPDHLADAFDQCRRAGSVSLMGCYNGVMMEFITREGYSTERLKIDHPYATCQDLDADFRPACYFHMAYWWNWKTGGNPSKVAALCAGIADAAERSACLMGAGKTFSEQSGFNSGKAAKYCDKMNGADERLLCDSGAYAIIAAVQRDTAGLCRTEDVGRPACVAMAAGVGYDTPIELRRIASELHP